MVLIFFLCYEIFNDILFFRFIKVLEKKGRLLRNYTQNIDTLEQVVGIENVIECHGKKIYLHIFLFNVC